MGGLAMGKSFALCVAAAMLAALSAEAAYRKGELLWKCDFTQAEAEKYGVARYKLSKSGLGMAYLPKDGKAGDGAMFFKTQSEKQTAMATIAPDVRFTGVVQVEAVVKGVEIAGRIGALVPLWRLGATLNELSALVSSEAMRQEAGASS